MKQITMSRTSKFVFLRQHRAKQNAQIYYFATKATTKTACLANLNALPSQKLLLTIKKDLRIYNGIVFYSYRTLKVQYNLRSKCFSSISVMRLHGRLFVHV